MPYSAYPSTEPYYSPYFGSEWTAGGQSATPAPPSPPAAPALLERDLGAVLRQRHLRGNARRP